MLYQYRLEKGLTIRSLSKISGVHETHISAIERLPRTPKLDTVAKLCKALQIPTYYITGADTLPEGSLQEKFEKARILKCHSINKACKIAGIDIHTYRRFTQSLGLTQDTLNKLIKYME